MALLHGQRVKVNPSDYVYEYNKNQEPVQNHRRGELREEEKGSPHEQTKESNEHAGQSRRL